MPSAIPGTKAAILTILAARAGLSGVNLSWAGPTKDEDFGGKFTGDVEMIYLGSVERASNWAALGQGRRVENYAVDLTVFVEQDGDDPQTAELRAYALLDEVEDALRDDLRATPSTLRTAGVLQFNEIRDRGSTGPSTSEKWGARIDASIDFQARNV